MDLFFCFNSKIRELEKKPIFIDMSTKSEKYIISEYFEFKADPQLIKEAIEQGGLITLVGILQKADTLNRNGRIYPYDILKRQAETYMQECVEKGVAYGELDHPDSAVVSLANVSHLVTDMWWQEKTLYGKVVVDPEDDAGKKLKSLLKMGGTLGISSRGVGSVTSKGGNDVVQEDFELIAFDFVSSPSTPGAYMFKEGVDAKRGMVPLTPEAEKIFKLAKDDSGSIYEYHQKLNNMLNDDFWKNI